MTRSQNKVVLSVSIGVVALLLIIVFFASFKTVGTGKIGVVTNYGRVTGREVTEGANWIKPFVEDVSLYDIKTQKEEQQAAAATKDLQDVNAKVVVNYRIESGKVSEIHKTVGVDYNSVIITPSIQSAFKSNAARYNAIDLVNKRGETESEVKADLVSRLSKRGIVVENVSIVDLNYSTEFTKAIESRQVAEQNAQRARYNLDQARLDAQAQQVQAETLTDNYLRLKEVENESKAIDKWDGKMPGTVAGESGLMFNIGK